MDFNDPLIPMRSRRPVAYTAQSLPDLLRQRCEATPRSVAYRSKRDGKWVHQTWSDLWDSASHIASFLIANDVAPQDKITLIGATRPEWLIGDMGGQLAGVVTVGAYPTLVTDQLAFIISHSDSKIVFAQGQAEVAKLLAAGDKMPELRKIIVWDLEGVDLRSDDRLVSFADALATPRNDAAITERIAKIDRDDCAIIVYTSGTTGPPKGAMISHKNILSVLRPAFGVPFDEHDTTLSFLPMAHVAERVMGCYIRLNFGVSTNYASSIPAVLDELQETRPTFFGSVPRIFEKAYAKIQAQVEKAPAPRRRLFRWAEAVGRRMVELWQADQPAPLSLRLQYEVADRLVFTKIRDIFGGRVRFFVTGAAPIPKKILEFFWAAGFPIFEMYGMTEATVVTHANRPRSVRLGSVGRPLDFAQCKLAQDGEVLVRGDMVFLGYYKNPEATKDTIDEDGWLHTGDIGKLDDDDYLHIVDRKKHLIITAGGKNLTPSNIENAIKTQDPILSNVHAHGDRRPYVTALVTLSPADAIDWALEHGVASDTQAAARMKDALAADPLSRPSGLDSLMDNVTKQPQMRQRIIDAVRRGNTQLARVEQVKRVHVLGRELSLDEDEITPTMKVKRRNIEKKFIETFDRLYSDDGFGLVVVER